MHPARAESPLRVELLEKRFGHRLAVDKVSFTVASGEMVAILGASGSGKSTVMRLISRQTAPDAGRILLGDFEATQLSGKQLLDWRAQCAMIFQQFHLSERLDAVTNVLMGGLRRMGTLRSLAGVFTRSERLAAAQALERVGMLPYALQRSGELSGGQKQRVAIARALVQQPAILLADEPISALDPRSAEIVLELLNSIRQEQRIRVLVNLHDVAMARRFAQRIIGMRDGRVVYDGSPAGLTGEVQRQIYGESLTRGAMDQGALGQDPPPAIGDPSTVLRRGASNYAGA
ncbi:MAG: phosphonate ABC transporter ATP-binding protein [Bryobacterales bacterium]|jgi:phosphonate transport system ATP-binding protein|nr:phosphonate ABC transporter ATP-binding protein [Bryobacterales bacterium]